MASEAVSDVVILAKKESAKKGYTVIENGVDGKSVNLGESKMFGGVRRYFAFTKQQPSPREGHAVIADLRILSWSETAPHDYYSIATTEDDHKEVFPSSNKSLYVKFVKITEAPIAVTDVIILSSTNKAQVPSGYKRLPDINGFTICYKVGAFRGGAGGVAPSGVSVIKEAVQVAESVPLGSAPPMTEPHERNRAQSYGGVPQLTRELSINKGPAIKACDGINVRVSGPHNMTDYMAKYDIVNRFKWLSIEDIEEKFQYNFSLENSCVNA